MDRMKWRKSSSSSANGGNCVEVAPLDPSAVGIRDSKSPNAGHLTFPRDVWAALTASIKAGRYDQR
ncbi:DUF397 domain-containing protein [Actinomadura macra]|uniref:DUF397 domain-containing protein n=1 Tax=Actinomadura macra TaxID=46164 RepID=UPI000A045566|nr:DUF397 domain-containing protein [Actinomadura macra]